MALLVPIEVSIYQELNGSNEWNGSVLAGMLVLGTTGALLPSLLKHDGSSSGTKFTASSELIVGDDDGVPHDHNHRIIASPSDTFTTIAASAGAKGFGYWLRLWYQC